MTIEMEAYNAPDRLLVAQKERMQCSSIKILGLAKPLSAPTSHYTRFK